MEQPVSSRASRSWSTGSVLSLAVGLAAVGVLFRQFGFGELAATLRQASFTGLLLTFFVGVVVRLGYALRWRLSARAFGVEAPLSRFLQARLAGDAVGAILPTGRISGDPLRIVLLRGEGERATMPTASVALDRFMEWIGNTFCALGCVTVFAMSRASAGVGTIWFLGGMIAVLGSLIAPLTMLRAGWRPFRPLHRLRPHVSPRLRRWLQLLFDTETQLIELFRHHPAVFTIGTAASLLIEIVILAEYQLLLTSFGLHLGWPTLMMVVVTGGLARAVPIPGGVGALEASQVGLLAVASGDAGLGFVVGIVVRLHEVLWTLVGFAALARRGGVERLRFSRSAGKAPA